MMVIAYLYFRYKGWGQKHISWNWKSLSLNSELSFLNLYSFAFVNDGDSWAY